MRPEEIEHESFRIILAELGQHEFSTSELAIVVRVIHATADFEYKQLLTFSPNVIQQAIDAFHCGCNVITDVRMVAAGIRRDLIEKYGGEVICSIDDPKVKERAEREECTRAAAAFRLNEKHLNGAIVVIGNAPTALYEIIHQVQTSNLRPAAIVGVPVGFVKAAESKAALTELDLPWIVTQGRKGGSTVAAAIVNALLKQ